MNKKLNITQMVPRLHKVRAKDGFVTLLGIGPMSPMLLQGTLELTPAGQVPVNEQMATSIPGVYAAGDIRTNSPAQMATAVGDGVTAAMALGRYITSL